MSLFFIFSMKKFEKCISFFIDYHKKSKNGRFGSKHFLNCMASRDCWIGTNKNERARAQVKFEIAKIVSAFRSKHFPINNWNDWSTCIQFTAVYGDVQFPTFSSWFYRLCVCVENQLRYVDMFTIIFVIFSVCSFQRAWIQMMADCTIPIKMVLFPVA